LAQEISGSCRILAALAECFLRLGQFGRDSFGVGALLLRFLAEALQRLLRLLDVMLGFLRVGGQAPRLGSER
jgi:hypothetical protein